MTISAHLLSIDFTIKLVVSFTTALIFCHTYEFHALIV